MVRGVDQIGICPYGLEIVTMYCKIWDAVWQIECECQSIKVTLIVGDANRLNFKQHSSMVE